MITGSQKPPMQGCHWCENPASTLQITAIPSQTKVKNYKNSNKKTCRRGRFKIEEV